MNYNKKHSSIFSIYQIDEKIIISDILKGEYVDIYNSMIEENFPLNVETCNIFNEIKFNEKVVGFSSYNLKNDSHIILTEIYILPSFRGNKLFNKELSHLFQEGYVVSIHEPSRKIVELLIDYGYAEKINKSLVVSAINFSVDKKHMLSGKDISNIVNEINLTNLYDLEICASLLFDIENNHNFEFYYSDTSIYDEKILSSDVRKNLDEDYFKNIVELLIRRDLEVERRLLLLRNNLPSENLEIKELFASNDLADIFMEYVNEGIVNMNEIKKIKQQLFIDLTRSTIRKQSIPIRLNYLVSNLHNNKEIDENIKNPCPYCKEELDYSQRYCVSCGYDIFNDMNIRNKKNFLYKDVLKEKLSYKHSIMNIMEQRDEFSEEYLLTLAICYVIDNLNIKNYYEIFNSATDIYNLQGHDLRKIMDNKGYITYDVRESDWFEEGQEFSVSELKKILIKNNIKQSGNKNELIERIKLNISLNKIKSKVPKITESGFKFKKDSFPLLYHKKYLENFVYEEFEEFYYNSEKTSIDEITIDFLNKHIQKAINSKNHNQLIQSLKLQSNLYLKMEDFEEVLRLELKIFLININMLFIDDVYYDYYDPIEEETFDNLKKLMYNYDFEDMVFLIGLFYDEFDENDLKIPLDEVVDILKRLFNQNNYFSLNNRIKYNHYLSVIATDSDSNQKKTTKITTLNNYF